MSKYGYLNCECSDPGRDYVESHEIIEVDDTGFTIKMRQSGRYLGREGDPNLKSAEEAYEDYVSLTKEWYDKYREGKYPAWIDHEHYVETYTHDGDVYANVYTRERINVPYEFIKEHSNDNYNYGYSVTRPSWSSATETDKELFKVLDEWTTNVRISDDFLFFTRRTWSLD